MAVISSAFELDLDARGRSRKRGSSISGRPLRCSRAASRASRATSRLEAPTWALPMRSWPSRCQPPSSPCSPRDQVLDRHLDVLEEDLVHLVAAVHQDQRAHGDAGVFMSISRKLMPSGVCRWRVGAHQAEDPVAVVAQRGPDLLAVDQVVVALTASARVLSARPGRSRAGLGIACDPEVVALADARREAVLLLGRAELEQHAGAHGGAEQGPGWARRRGRTLVVDVALGDVPARATLLGPVWRTDLYGQDLVPAHHVLARGRWR